jgi:dTDP-4-amino-4,6-dideoxygalactose transaminase
MKVLTKSPVSVSHTFVATIEVIKFLGATPILIDIAEDHNMNIDLVEKAITEKTKAIIPVQLNGRICTNMDKLVQITKEKNILLIEDAAQAVGAKYKGKGAGTFGIAGCYSFYPAKILGAFGDAGAIVTNNEEFAYKLKKIRNHGREGAEVTCWGMNSRLDNLHAAILNYKLKLLPKWIERRREIAFLYHKSLNKIQEIKLPPSPEQTKEHFDVFQNYEIEAERRDELMRFLREEKGIEVTIQWGGKGVHQFNSLGLNHFHLPRTEEFFKKGLLLPMYPELSNKDINYVINSIEKFYARNE